MSELNIGTNAAADTNQPAADTNQPAQAPAAETQQPARPEGIPEKFWTGTGVDVAGLAKAYAELERKQSAGQPQEQPKSEIPPPSPAGAVKMVEGAGLNYSDLEAEYQSTQKLSDASIQKLEAAGIPRAMVDSYIAGLEAQQSKITGEIYQSVGGQEAYAKMTAWAAANWSAKEIDSFNAMIGTGTGKMALTALQAAYNAANPAEPTSITGGAVSTTGDAYASKEEMIRDMRNPLYAKDPAFRTRVQNKLARSNI